GDVELSAATLETLLNGSSALEAVIVARRKGLAPPAGDAAMETLRALSSTDSQTPPLPSPALARDRAVDAARVWTVRFVPQPDLIGRGIKVDAIRARLLQIGKILAVAPHVRPGGGIEFQFEVQTDDEASLASWSGDGISYEPSRTHT